MSFLVLVLLPSDGAATCILDMNVGKKFIAVGSSCLDYRGVGNYLAKLV